MAISNVSIDGKRLLADLYRLREFGTYKTGVHRPTFSKVDMDSRHWLMERMREAGLAPEIDGIGNVIGRGAGDGPRLLLGSHTETQPHAGWLDGALGVMFGLEVARAVGHGIDVVAWADEEGHYGSFLGSRSYIGALTEAEIDAGRNRYDGTTLRQALAQAGLEGRARIAHQPGRYVGYMEAHIEQGDDLEARALKIGVVTSIVGIWAYRIAFTGTQNHAGTTRMAIRRDAGVALVKLCSAIEAKFPQICGPRTVWDGGPHHPGPRRRQHHPGRGGDDAAVPRRRSRDARAVGGGAGGAGGGGRWQALRRGAAQGVALHAEPDGRGVPGGAGPCRRTLRPGLHQRMPSGAGHDAQWLARLMPAAMLFVPSIGGISHHWSEDTSDADIVLGCQVMAAAAAEILAG